MQKRVVLHHPNGLMQIMGLASDPPIVSTDQPFEALGRYIPFASLVRVTSRMAVYREPMTPGSASSFHEMQR